MAHSRCPSAVALAALQVTFVPTVGALQPSLLDHWDQMRWEPRPEMLSTLVVLEQAGSSPMRVAVATPSRHMPDIDEDLCGDGSQESRYEAHTAGQAGTHHRFNAHFQISRPDRKSPHGEKMVDCVQMVYGSLPGTVERRHDWIEEASLTGLEVHEQKARSLPARLGWWGASDEENETVVDRHEHRGHAAVDDEEVYPLHLPLGVKELFLEHKNGTRERYTWTPSQNRRAHTTQLRVPELLTGGQRMHGYTSGSDPPSTSGNMNIIFVAAGYKSAGGGAATGQARFEANVNTAMEYLKFPGKYGVTGGEIPIARYFSTYNVFLVWQESAADGASQPAVGLTVDNNLACTYGSGTGASPGRALVCPKSSVIAMAEVAPAVASSKNTLIVSLVNDVVYGGTGIFQPGVVRYCSFYNGGIEDASSTVQARAASLLYHEFQHAFADISDEYTVGLSQGSGRNCAPTTAVTLPTYQSAVPGCVGIECWGFWSKYNPTTPRCHKNCAFSTTGLGWQAWIDAAELAAPSLGCYYTNWYRPSDSCLMKVNGAPRLCPVCREAGVLMLYENGMDLTYPSCPDPNLAHVYVSNTAGEGSKVTLFANNRLFNPDVAIGKVGMTISWMVNGNTITGETNSYFHLDAAAGTGYGPLTAGVNKVKAVAVDATSWVILANRPPAMQSTSIEWTIQVKASKGAISAALSAEGILSTQQLGQCDNTGPFYDGLVPSSMGTGWPLDPLGGNAMNPYIHFRSCVGNISATAACTCASRTACTCLAINSVNKKCAVEYSAQKYTSPGSLGKFASAVEDMLLGMGGGILLGSVMLLVGSWLLLAHFFGRTPSRVMEDSFSRPIKWARNIMVGAAVGFALVSLAGMILVGNFYTKVGAIAQMGLIIGGGIMFLFFIGSFMGFFAAYYRSILMLSINGFALIVGTIMCIGFGSWLYNIGYTCNDPGSKVANEFETNWFDGVKSRPEEVCSTQDYFKCSGWTVACNQFRDPMNCPKNCDEINEKYPDTCKVEIIKFIHDWFPLAGSILMAFFYCLAVGVVLNFLMIVALKKSDDLNQHKMEMLMDGPIQSILKLVNMSKGAGDPGFAAKFIRKCTDEFKKVDTDGSGELDREEFKRLFKTLMGIDDKLQEKREKKLAGAGAGPPPRSIEDFTVGQLVMHKVRGPGTVTAIGGDPAAVTIAFDGLIGEHNPENPSGEHHYKESSLQKGGVQPRKSKEEMEQEHAEKEKAKHRCCGLLPAKPAEGDDDEEGGGMHWEEKLDAVFELLDLDGSGRIELEEWLEVLWLAADMGPEPVWEEYEKQGRSREEFETDLDEWKDRAEQFSKNIEERNEANEENMLLRRDARVLQMIDSETEDGGLKSLAGAPTEEPHPDAPDVEVDAWRLLGSLSDEQWERVVNTFNELAVVDHEEQMHGHSAKLRVIICDNSDNSKPGAKGYKQYLEEEYLESIKKPKLPPGGAANFSQKKTLQMLEELPVKIDRDGNGKLEWVEWLATFYIRCKDIDKLDWVKYAKQTHKEKVQKKKETKKAIKEGMDPKAMKETGSKLSRVMTKRQGASMSASQSQSGMQRGPGSRSSMRNPSGSGRKNVPPLAPGPGGPAAGAGEPYDVEEGDM